MSLLSAGRRCPSNAPLFQGFFFLSGATCFPDGLPLRCCISRSKRLSRSRRSAFLKGSYRRSGLSRFSSGTYLDVSHVAVRHIVTRVAVTNPPAMFDGVSADWPFDSLGLNVMPGTPIIYHPGDTTDDTKFTAQDLINLVNRGDIR